MRIDDWQLCWAMSKYVHERLPEDPELGPGRQLPAILIVFSTLKRVIKDVHALAADEVLQASLNVSL